MVEKPTNRICERIVYLRFFMRPKFAIAICFSFATIAVLNGCVPYWQGKETEAEVLALRGQVDHLVEAHRKQKSDFEGKIAEFSVRLDTMSKRLSDSVVSLRTNSANSGSHIDEMRALVQQLQGEIAELRHRLPGNGLVPSSVEGNRSPLPEDKRALFNFGARAFETGNCVDAIRAFDGFVTRFPKDPNTDNALTLMGECLNQQGQFREAVRALSRIFTDFPNGEKVDDALYVMHESLKASGRCAKAKECLQTLLENHPRSNRKAAAKKALKTLKKQCKPQSR